jgi:hypothetical protein
MAHAASAPSHAEAETAVAPSSHETETETGAPLAPQADAASPRSARPAIRAPTAHVALFGDEGTTVAIDGVNRGACPVRDVSLEPGPHDVRFTFAPTGESRGERIVISSGERVTLRADFVGATPSVRIER